MVGMARLEKSKWTDVYEGDPVLYGDFGTKENPVIVHSWFPSRIVGCQGMNQTDDEFERGGLMDHQVF